MQTKLIPVNINEFTVIRTELFVRRNVSGGGYYIEKIQLNLNLLNIQIVMYFR